MTAIAMIDDHDLLCQVVATQLERRGHPTAMIDLGQPILDQVRRTAPELVLLDLELGPDRPDGRQLVEALLDVCPDVLIVTGVADDLIIAECLELGVRGVLMKSSSFDELVDAITACCAGDPVAPTASERVRLANLLGEQRRVRRRQLEPFGHLSDREAAVLRALMDGRSAAEISAESFVSISTVRTQIKAILRKLGVTSQLQAVAMARNSGWPEVSTASSAA